jgi:hypothetical protein
MKEYENRRESPDRRRKNVGRSPDPSRRGRERSFWTSRFSTTGAGGLSSSPLSAMANLLCTLTFMERGRLKQLFGEREAGDARHTLVMFATRSADPRRVRSRLSRVSRIVRHRLGRRCIRRSGLFAGSARYAFSQDRGNLEKLKGWLTKTRKLDFYQAPLSAEADSRLQHCATLLETYAGHLFEAHEENRAYPPSRPDARNKR